MKDDGVLVIQKIHVTYTLNAAQADEDTILRAYEMHAPRCPVYKTLSGCIDISTELEVVEG